jgi:hypothetical protein
MNASNIQLNDSEVLETKLASIKQKHSQTPKL